jgi:transposase
MIEAGADDPAGLPVRVRGLLKDALALRDAKAAGEVAPDDYVAGIDALARRRDGLLAREPADPAEARFVRHLRRQADGLFSFLSQPGVDATNHASERAIRPAVVNRKSWGGNLTWRGAGTQEVLVSVLRTARMQDRDPIEILTPLLVSPQPRVADLAIPRPRPRRLALPAERGR